MKSKIKIGIIVFLTIILGYCVQSNAAISTQSKEVQSGEQFTISVTSNVSLASYSIKAESYAGLTFITSTGGTGEGTTSISNALASGGRTSLATFTFKAPEVTKDTKYTIKFTAEGMGDENLQPVSNSTATATITVKAQNTMNPETPSTPSTPVAKSSEVRLSNFGIRPNEYDFSGFSRNREKEEWSVTVPNKASEVEVYATALDKNAKIEGTGKVSLKEGSNKVEVKVTAEDGKTTKTYTLTINRKTEAEEEKESGEARLKNLGINPEQYDFTGFTSDVTEYATEVPNEVTEIEIYATAINSSAQITGTGKIELKEGKNDLTVEVIAANGTKKTYTISVTRKESENVAGTTEKKLGLSMLLIKGVTLNPTFNTETYEYTVDITEALDSLEIQTEANEQDATVEVMGNENLHDGENTITILVKNKEVDKVTTYQIIVNKNVAKEEVFGKEEIIKTIIIVVLIILIISAIILKIKMSKESVENEVNLPGAEELDKAMAEHQELSSEEPEKIEENEQDEVEEKNKKKGRHF